MGERAGRVQRLRPRSEIPDAVGGCGLVESKGLFLSFGQGTLVADLPVESCDGLSCGERGSVGGGKRGEEIGILSANAIRPEPGPG